MNRRTRDRFCYFLALGSPCLFSAGTIAMSLERVSSSASINPIVVWFGAASSMLGSIVGVLLAPEAGSAVRIFTAVLYGPASLIAYLIIVRVSCRLIYFYATGR